MCQFGLQELARTFKHLFNDEDWMKLISITYSDEMYLNWIESSDYFIYGAYVQKPKLPSAGATTHTGEDVDNKHKEVVKEGESLEMEEELVGYVLSGPNSMSSELISDSGEDAKGDHKEGVQAPAGEIKRIYIHPDQFGGGVADHLLTAGLNWLRRDPSNKNMKVYLSVYTQNPRAQRFYSKHGFKVLNEYPFFSGPLASDHPHKVDIIMNVMVSAPEVL